MDMSHVLSHLVRSIKKNYKPKVLCKLWVRSKQRAVLSLELGPFKILSGLHFYSKLNAPFQPSFVTPSPLEDPIKHGKPFKGKREFKLQLNKMLLCIIILYSNTALQVLETLSSNSEKIVGHPQNTLVIALHYFLIYVQKLITRASQQRDEKYEKTHQHWIFGLGFKHLHNLPLHLGGALEP